MVGIRAPRATRLTMGSQSQAGLCIMILVPSRPAGAAYRGKAGTKHPPEPLLMTDVPLEIDCRTTKGKLEAGGNFVLLDCREPDEFATAHIEGAKLLPMSELADRVAELEPYRSHQIVVHCHHGGRSLRVTRWLREQGFPTAQNMAGGIDQWSVEIDPQVPRY